MTAVNFMCRTLGLISEVINTNVDDLIEISGTAWQSFLRVIQLELIVSLQCLSWLTGQ